MIKKLSLVVLTMILLQGFVFRQEEASTDGKVIICPSGDTEVCMHSHTMGTIYKGKKPIIIF